MAVQFALPMVGSNGKGKRYEQPYFIYRVDSQPIFMAAIGSMPFEHGDETEGF